MRRYTPIDIWEARPLTRVLRALMRRSWVEGRTLFEAFGLGSDAERDAYSQAIAQGLRKSYLERRGPRGAFEFRLTTKGRVEILRRLAPDLGVEFAPARPGTEHLLCE